MIYEAYTIYLSKTDVDIELKFIENISAIFIPL